MSRAQGNALLEEWQQPSSTMVTKKVAFATYSELQVYRLDPVFESRKSYTSSERKAFRAQALHDAFYIQRLMENCPYEGGHAMNYLIERNLLSPEDLLGIEDLITGAEKITVERRRYAKYVMKTQLELKKTQASDADLKLAYVAAAKSMKAFEKARLRAALAAWAYSYHTVCISIDLKYAWTKNA